MEGLLSDAIFAYKMQFGSGDNQCGRSVATPDFACKCSKYLNYQQPMAEVIAIARLGLHRPGRGPVAPLLVEGRIAPGAKLNERELAEQLRVSRTPLREAIKLLAAEGLVDLLPNRGAVAVQADGGRHRCTPSRCWPGWRPCPASWRRSASPTAELAEIRAMHYEMLAAFTRRDLSNYYRLNAAIHTRASTRPLPTRC